jgi:outer membrane lipoprotein-sorting protein
MAEWQPPDNAVAQTTSATPSSATALFPRAIRIERPHDDYKLDLQVTKVILNEEIPAERFKLEQPAGAELVRVGDATENKQP